MFDINVANKIILKNFSWHLKKCNISILIFLFKNHARKKNFNFFKKKSNQIK